MLNGVSMRYTNTHPKQGIRTQPVTSLRCTRLYQLHNGHLVTTFMNWSACRFASTTHAYTVKAWFKKKLNYTPPPPTLHRCLLQFVHANVRMFKNTFWGAPSSFAVWLEISTCAPWLDFFFYSFYLLCLSTSFCSLLFKNCLKKKMLKTTNNYCLPPKVVVVVGGGGGKSELRTNN